MMKKLLTLAALILPFVCQAQGGWTKITSGNPIATFPSNGIYKGAAWVDINNDGKIDLFAMPGFMFLNNGGGSFTQLTGLGINPSPLQVPGGCSWGDINNDGYIDFITAQNPSEIYINKGDTTFQNITASIPSLNGYAAWGCALADINNDNKLDLLYAQAYGFHGSAMAYPCKLFTQDAGSFSFTPRKGYAFTDTLRPYTVPYFHDYDMDGDMDLFIASGPGGSPGPDYCYKNMKMETGLDTLFKMEAEPWAQQLQDGQCYNFIDYDNDGDMDMCLTNYAGATTRFYENEAGTYTAKATPFTGKSSKLSNSWGDFDNDGDLDVIISDDSQKIMYYRNNADGTFAPVANTINVTSFSSGVASCDYDNDGDLDIFISGQNGARSLWRNDSVALNHNWVNYTLKGVISNRSAIGAFVKIKATINGKSVWQTRQVTAQNNFQGQNDLRVHFGLDTAAIIDSLLIYWPSGIKEFYINKHANRFETIIEGNGTALGLNDMIENDNVKFYPNPANSSVTIQVDKLSGKINLHVTDISGKTIYETGITKNNTVIPVSELKPGIYIFSLEGTAFSFSKRIVVEK